ncbi:MAG: DUF2662 domain-containing protein [Acidobacteria bacterium]|nr:DUF2662 domain-containing protein [Acidobacteriota bacterium]
MKNGLFDQLETRLRRLFQQAGGAVDLALGRGDQPELDPTVLLAHIETEIESGLREESGRLIAPHLIELRYSYETWNALGSARREQLERELTASLLEYICNRRYRTAGPLQVTIGYDAFTRGVAVQASSGERRPESTRREVRISVVEQATGIRHDLQLASGAGPAGIGRNIANAIVIKNPTISNFHAALVLRETGRETGEIELADRGGANGTAINGVRLADAGRARVTDGDMLRFGSVVCRILIEEQS